MVKHSFSKNYALQVNAQWTWLVWGKLCHQATKQTFQSSWCLYLCNIFNFIVSLFVLMQEYSDNLIDSGVHGGIVVLETSFGAEAMATALGIPQAKGMIRRHLVEEMKALVNPVRLADTSLVLAPLIQQCPLSLPWGNVRRFLYMDYVSKGGKYWTMCKDWWTCAHEQARYKSLSHGLYGGNQYEVLWALALVCFLVGWLWQALENPQSNYLARNQEPVPAHPLEKLSWNETRTTRSTVERWNGGEVYG